MMFISKERHNIPQTVRNQCAFLEKNTINSILHYNSNTYFSFHFFVIASVFIYHRSRTKLTHKKKLRQMFGAIVPWHMVYIRVHIHVMLQEYKLACRCCFFAPRTLFDFRFFFIHSSYHFFTLVHLPPR